MNIKPIKTESDYQAALAEIERLFDADPGTPEGDRLEVLTTLVEVYEEGNYSIPPPTPVEAMKYYLESQSEKFVATSESEVAKQRTDFETLLETLGQGSFSEIAKALQEREIVAPESGLTPEVVARLQRLINERLTSEERLMMETVS